MIWTLLLFPQGPEHPNPGKKFTARGFPRHCYLPNNEKGRKVGAHQLWTVNEGGVPSHHLLGPSPLCPQSLLYHSFQTNMLTAGPQPTSFHSPTEEDTFREVK